MRKRLVIASLATVSLGLFGTGMGTSLLYAQNSNSPMVFEDATGGPRLLEEGQPPAMVHPTVDRMERIKQEDSRGKAKASGGGKSSSNLSYHNGNVETAPRVYLILWGSQWSNDPSGEATILTNFYNGAGGSNWLNSVIQYCQGVAPGTVYCNGTGAAAGNPKNILAAVWSDNATAAPAQPSQSQIAQEAVRAAQHFNNTTANSNANVQYVIATATGNNSSGFGSSYCAYHSYTTSAVGKIAYTNLPYMTDAGATCGGNFNGLGSNAGITIVAGHELAETITDQYPNGGWVDSRGEENADKCAWIASGQGASQNITFSNGTFPVQSLWSNTFSGGSGGCVVTYP